MPVLSQPVQKGRTAITTTNSEPAQKAPTALFSHPLTQHANGKASAPGNGQPAYENLFQEPAIPTHRETLD